jgi:outer membrane protein assembly factor BamD
MGRSYMNHSLPRAALAAALALLLAACSTDPDKLPPTSPFKGGKSERELRLEADGLYKLARRSLDTADYQGAIQRYDQVQLRYPFTDYATQSQLESIYAKYRSFDADGAVSTAERFLKEHPRHPQVDYVYYLKGLVNFQRGESLFDWLVSSSGQDVGYAHRAYDDFALLLQRYPNSRFAADARLRMVHLRNKIAEHELTVVRYYVRRGAHIAAAKRAEKIIAEYPGAPATVEALLLLEKSYREAGLASAAADVRRLREANPAAAVPATAPKLKPGLFETPPNPIPETAPSVSRAPATDDWTVAPGAVVREVSPTSGTEGLPPGEPQRSP